MKKILVLIVGICSFQLPAWACDEEIMRMEAFAAAAAAEAIDLQGVQPAIEFQPMSSHNVYKIVFTYSGFRNVWRVEMDDNLCRVQSVQKL